MITTRTEETTAMRSSLTTISNAIAHIIAGHDEAAGYDAGFDAGEFSGPEHARAVDREIATALSDNGWTAGEFEDELIARTNQKFAYFSGLTSRLETERP